LLLPTIEDEMKAAVCREFGAPLVIEEVTLDPPGRGEVRIELAACAVCHSDITFTAGGWGARCPRSTGTKPRLWSRRLATA